MKSYIEHYNKVRLENFIASAKRFKSAIQYQRVWYPDNMEVIYVDFQKRPTIFGQLLRPQKVWDRVVKVDSFNKKD